MNSVILCILCATSISLRLLPEKSRTAPIYIIYNTYYMSDCVHDKIFHETTYYTQQSDMARYFTLACVKINWPILEIFCHVISIIHNIYI